MIRPETPSSAGVDPSLFLGASSTNDALTEFNSHAPDLDPLIADTLRGLGDEAIEAYASVKLYHNTLNTLVPSILVEGLHAESAAAIPEAADVSFAEELFRAKGFFHPDSARQFDIYIKGQRSDREPGIFFYGKNADSSNPFHEGYGQPERLLIFAQEMGNIMLQTKGPYTDEERQKARELFTKYAAVVNGGETGHIAILRANPFSPDIFNYRLANLPNLDTSNTQAVLATLKELGIYEFEGIYVPGMVAPDDLELMSTELPIEYKLEEANLNPAQSRYFYTPSGLTRT